MSTNKTKIGKLEYLKREMFRLELNSIEYKRYPCYYTASDKRKIMHMIRQTNWELPFIRNVFQNYLIKSCFDEFYTIFSFLNTEVTEKRDFVWNLIGGILNDLHRGRDFSVIIDFLELFFNSFDKLYNDDSIDARKKRQAVFNYGYDLLFKKEYECIDSSDKKMLFESIINSSNNGLYLGEEIIKLYRILSYRLSISRLITSGKLGIDTGLLEIPIYLLDSGSISTIAKVFEGSFDYNSDITNIISSYSQKYVNEISYLEDYLHKLERYALKLESHEALVKKEELENILKKYPEIQDKKYLDELLTMYNHRNCVGYKEWVSDAYPNIEEIAQTVLELRYVNSYLGAFCIDNPDIGLCINLEDMTLLENDYKELFDLFKSLNACVSLAESNFPISLEGVGLKACDGSSSVSGPTVRPSL